MLTNEDVQCNLAKLRKRAGFTQSYVVLGANDHLKALGIEYELLDRVALSKAEMGSVILIPNHVHAIAAFLDCSAHDIYPYLYPKERNS